MKYEGPKWNRILYLVSTKKGESKYFTTKERKIRTTTDEIDVLYKKVPKPR